LAQRLLRDGHEVAILDDFSRGRRDPDLAAIADSGKVRLIDADLRAAAADPAFPRDSSLVFHLAAIVGVQSVLERPYDTLFRNVTLTDAAIALSRRQDRLERLIFASTSEVYAGSVERGQVAIPTPESTALTLTELDKPRTSYLLSKICGESLCHYAGLPVTIMRPHNVYGPRMGMAHVIPQLLERAHRLREGERLGVHSIDHTRTFCFIDDAVEMMLRAATTPACAGETLNLGAQSPEVTIGRLAEIVLSTVGRRTAVEPLPAHPGSPVRRCPDMARTSWLTGHVAGVSLEEGVARTHDWYRRHFFT